jgi:hypothetical protein
MLQEKELKSVAAGKFAWAAARDANRYSDECRMLYTNAQRARAESFNRMVEMAYTNVRPEPTYRKSFVVIKIEQGRVRDRTFAQMVEDEAIERGYVRTVTPQSVNYRITF